MLEEQTLARIDQVKLEIEKRIQIDCELQYKMRPNTLEAGCFEPFEHLNEYYKQNSFLGALRPRIEIYRNNEKIPDSEPTETITLAHEYGHLESWRKCERPEGLTRASDKYFVRGEKLDPEEIQLILDEEARAWRYARNVLAELKFEEWAAFDNHETESQERNRENYAEAYPARKQD